MLRHGSCVLVVVCVVVVLLLFVVNVLAIECWDAFANTADTLIVCAGMFPRNFVLLWMLRNYLQSAVAMPAHSLTDRSRATFQITDSTVYKDYRNLKKVDWCCLFLQVIPCNCSMRTGDTHCSCALPFLPVFPIIFL